MRLAKYIGLAMVSVGGACLYIAAVVYLAAITDRALGHGGLAAAVSMSLGCILIVGPLMGLVTYIVSAR